MKQEGIFAIVAEYIKLCMSIQVHVQVKTMFVRGRICTCSTTSPVHICVFLSDICAEKCR